MWWEYKSYLSTQMWKIYNFAFKNIIYFNLFYASFWHRKRNSHHKYRILLLPPCDKWDAVGRWWLLCPALVAGGVSVEKGKSTDFQHQVHGNSSWDARHPFWPFGHQSMQIVSETPLLLLPDLFRNLALSIPSVSHLRPWKSLQGHWSFCFPSCEPASLLSGLFPAGGCRFSLSFSETCK